MIKIIVSQISVEQIGAEAHELTFIPHPSVGPIFRTNYPLQAHEFIFKDNGETRISGDRYRNFYPQRSYIFSFTLDFTDMSERGRKWDRILSCIGDLVEQRWSFAAYTRDYNWTGRYFFESEQEALMIKVKAL